MFGRRRRYLVKKKLQFKYLLFVLLAMLIPTIVVGAALYYLIWETIAAEIAVPEAIAAALVPALEKVNVILIISVPLVFAVILLFSVFISHRIAGPVYRLEKEMKKIADGDYSRRIKLRSNDELQEIAEGINSVLEHFAGSKKDTDV